MRLFGVEIRRLLSRRAFWLLTLGVFLIFGWIAGATAWDSHPPTDDEVAQAQQMVEENQRFMEEDHERCEEEGWEDEPEEFGIEDCDEILESAPMVEDFTYSSLYSFADEAPDQIAGLVWVVAAFAFVIGATFVGAEWSSGMISTLLTWQPRRLRLATAKTAAAVLIVTVTAAILLALVIGSLYIVADIRGMTDRTTDDVVRNIVLTALRGTGLAAGLAAIGAGLAGTLRSTVGPLVAALAYAVGIEGFARSLWPDSDRWLLSNNVLAWIGDGVNINRYDCSDLSECTETSTRITLIDGALVLGIVLFAALMLHAVTFARRDVA